MKLIPHFVLLVAMTVAACGRSGGKAKDPVDTGTNNASNNGTANNGASNSGTDNASNNGSTSNANNVSPTNNAATNNSNNATTNNTTSCAGCMLDGECLAGDSEVTCGADGAACLTCADGWVCFEGTCVEPPDCGAENCANGCCDPTRGCVTGDTEAACGTGGVVCATCTPTETCDGRVCLGPCADRCFGCCVGEVCRPGNVDGECGAGGAACDDCGVGASCNAQQACVSDVCSLACAGCCAGDVCETGMAANACGVNGDACVDCGQGRTCINQTCTVDPTSRWEVVLEAGVVSMNDASNQPWDIIGLPDVFIDIELYDAGTMTAYRDTSSILQDDSTPTWNESVIANVPASAFYVWRIDVWDSDLDLDDAICTIDVDLSGQPQIYQGLFSGATYTFSCNDPNSGVFADLNIHLQR